MDDVCNLTTRLTCETFLRGVEHHAELHSTNDRALELLREGFPDLPLLILADKQHAGRGRGANRWWSAEGALTFSVVLQSDPGEPRPDGRIALWTGVAVAETLRGMVGETTVQLKWPNDVLLNGRKVGGVLIEIPPQLPNVAVVGIGLNVNNTTADAPAEFRERATSLRDEAGGAFDRIDLLVELLRNLERTLPAIRESLSVTWGTWCWLTGRRVAVRQGPRTVVGVCEGVGEDGGLLLQTDAGPRTIYSADSVRLAE